MKRFFKILKKIFLILLILILLISVTAFFYLRKPQFGENPTGKRLERIKSSPNYKNGKFRNIIERPTMSEGYTIMGELYNTLFKKYPRRQPAEALPSVKTDVLKISADSNVAVWFGHSSIFLQVDNKKFLIDPVFSEKASPLPWGPKAYKGTNIYNAGDMPEIDYLVISHDHYDHLDYETIVALKNKVKHVICGLGIGAHFEHWGYQPTQITELDWNENVDLSGGFTMYGLSSHHDGGRGLRRANTLWMSYLLQTPTMKIFLSGDGGFDDRFKNVGVKFDSIDFAIMECGQYDKAWQSVHCLPEEVAQATKDLKAKRMLPIHHSKFTLGKHSWDEPLVSISALSDNAPYKLSTPMIGELIDLKNTNQPFQKWWQGVE